MTVKQSVAFPEAGQIRKGAPKIKRTDKNGKPYEVVGPDLGKYFRLAFHPGAEDVRDAYLKLHPEAYKDFGPDSTEREGVITTRINAMLPFQTIGKSWQWFNEAHNAGRMVARADDDHYITMRDPKGIYQVENGEPYVPFKHGMVVKYTNHTGKEIELPIKSTCRLTVFIPELARWVCFQLKSTSYYDRVQIDSQLAAIQFFADTLNRGNCGGIPFTIYRKEQEVCWNKADGSAARVKKWLINIECDPEWVKVAVSRMSNFALTGEVMTKALLPLNAQVEPVITGAYSPDVSDLEPEEEPEMPPEADDPNVITVITTPEPAIGAGAQPAAAPTQPAVGAPTKRPYAPEQVKAELNRLAAKYDKYTTSDNQKGLMVGTLTSCFSDQADPEDCRRQAISYIFGVLHTDELKSGQMQAILQWMKPTKEKDTNHYVPDMNSVTEAKAIYMESLRANGQLDMFGPPLADNPETL